MKLISCHHIKKRPPKVGGMSGELIRRYERESCCINERPSFDCDALINAKPNDIEPSASLKCSHLVRCSRLIYHSRRVFKMSLLLSLVCLIIISDFQHYQNEQLNQEIAKKCAQKDLEEETELQNSNYNRELASITNNNKQQLKYMKSSSTTTNDSAHFQEKLESIERTRSKSNENEHQDRNEYEKSTCLTSNNKLRRSLSLVNLFWPKNGLILFAQANVDANRLYEDLMMTYNRIVLPVQNNTDRVVVKLALKLSQLIDVVSMR